MAKEKQTKVNQTFLCESHCQKCLFGAWTQRGHALCKRGNYTQNTVQAFKEGEDFQLSIHSYKYIQIKFSALGSFTNYGKSIEMSKGLN